MRYLYAAFIFVSIHLISIYIVFGKMPSFNKSSSGSTASTIVPFEDFIEASPILPQGLKKNNVVFGLLTKERQYKQIEQRVFRVYNYFSYAHYLLFLNFLYPKHVFW